MTEDDDLFTEWLKARAASDENPWGILKHERLLREAFEAGITAMAFRMKCLNVSSRTSSDDLIVNCGGAR